MKDLIFDPFPVLYTARLNLRALNIDDAESMHQLRSRHLSDEIA